MKLSDLSIHEIQHILRDTKKAIGPNSYEVRVLQAELARRRKRTLALKPNSSQVIEGQAGAS